MDLKSIAKDLKDQTDYRLDQRFEELMRKNPRYQNLDAGNRELIFDLLRKYKEKLRHGIKPSRLTVKEDMYHLYQNRLKLNLTYNDLDQIRDLLAGLKG
ncbi:MAG: hypothetical protein WC523_01550 [Patescibacteria group bacterium]|jgi:hypothetical protein